MTGPYKLIRHPIYTTVLILVWSSVLGHPSQTTLIVNETGRVKGLNRFRYLGACTDLKPGELLIPGFPKVRMEQVYTPVRK